MRRSAEGQDRADRRRPRPFRALARALLQLEGFEVVGEAANALSALDAVERLRPNVVVLDVQLP
jgi:DNA-binding NarL/FixJ family response regulator